MLPSEPEADSNQLSLDKHRASFLSVLAYSLVSSVNRRGVEIVFVFGNPFILYFQL